ncbi:MAG TPA: methyltransferase domain-containing protein [Planctomycetota bacterium]|jgi:SAM-dependent methyltransferase|nr:methyltransferase domain-containing protein [Planctomycetota bacterium]
MSKTYAASFFRAIEDSSRQSARVVVPLVMDWVRPARVIDLGCGRGTWLAVFRENGVSSIRGVDGDYVERDRLSIPPEAFVPHDLSIPYAADGAYDLAISLEVAEHLPPESGEALVRSLMDLAPVVLFSAAIPHQPGDHHVNGQWPAYWAERFAGRGYVSIDAVRPRIWDDSRIAWWYRQNTVLYVREDRLAKWPELESMGRSNPARPLSLVHPEMLDEFVKWGTGESKKYWDLYRQTRGGAAGGPAD